MNPSTLILVATIALAPSMAHAASPDPVTEDQPAALRPVDKVPAASPNETHWYGAPMVALDVLAIAASTASVLSPLSAGGYEWAFAANAVTTLGSPIFHLAHHNPGRALGSLALRLTLPIAGAVAGAAMSDGGPCFGIEGIAIGSVAGSVLAAALDDGLLAHEERPVGVSLGPASGQAPAHKVTVRPSVVPMRGGAFGSLRVTF